MPSKYIQFIYLFAFICGCVPRLPQDFRPKKEEIVIPEVFPTIANEKTGDGKEPISIVSKDWKFFIEDEQLRSLIQIALKNNQEINILKQEINIAKNTVMAKQGKYLPNLGLGAGYEHERASKFTRNGIVDDLGGLPKKLDIRTVGMTSSWEVDIWKKLRNSAKSAYYNYLSSVEVKNFATTQLVAEIASTYYELMALDNQLEIVEQYLKTLRDAQEVVELQQFAGRTTSLAVKRFTAETLKNESRTYQIQQQITVTENKLNTLLGRFPQKIERKSQDFLNIEMKGIAAGLPANILENRPDVKGASLKLKAAKLNVKSIKAEFYPSLNIDASVGYQSFNSKHFVRSPSALFYNAAGGVTAPLLNRKAIKAEYFSANNEQIKAIYSYEQTFIKAFTEVVNQLNAVNNLKEIYDLKSQQTKVLSDSFEISEILFKAARIDYLESLLTRRDYLESQMELIDVKQHQLSAYVNLYKTLGGGWRE